MWLGLGSRGPKGKRASDYGRTGAGQRRVPTEDVVERFDAVHLSE